MILSERNRLDSVGKEVSRKTVKCDNHGQFVSICRLHFGGRNIWSSCPACLSAEIKNTTQVTPNALAESAGISRRFMSASNKSYIPKNESQVRAKSALSRFGLNFKKISQSGAGIVITGETGSGKTHLVSALVHGLSSGGYSAKIINAMELIMTIRLSYSDKSITEKGQIKIFTDLDLLVIDEVGVQLGSASELVTLFNVIDRRYHDMKPTIIVANMESKELSEFLTPRTYRRVVGDGLVLNIKGSD